MSRKPRTASAPRKRARKSHVTPFLQLPGEIRNKIYGHVCVNEDPLWIEDGNYNGRRPGSTLWSPYHTLRTRKEKRRYRRLARPALMFTCRTIYEETRKIVYSENEFSAVNLHVMGSLLSRLNPIDLGSIRRLQLEHPYIIDDRDWPKLDGKAHAAAGFLIKCTSLSRLTLWVFEKDECPVRTQMAAELLFWKLKPWFCHGDQEERATNLKKLELTSRYVQESDLVSAKWRDTFMAMLAKLISLDNHRTTEHLYNLSNLHEFDVVTIRQCLSFPRSGTHVNEM